jgi:uncharacterized glyoxalase superfamily protein PhnB
VNGYQAIAQLMDDRGAMEQPAPSQRRSQGSGRHPVEIVAYNASGSALPPAVQTLTPHLVVRGTAQAADWYHEVFGAQVGSKTPVPGGKFIQIELCLGDARVMLADEFPDMGVLSRLSVGGTYGALHLATENADALWERAVEAGPPCISHCRTCSGAIVMGRSSTRSGTAGASPSTFRTSRPRRSPGPRHRCSVGSLVDDAKRLSATNSGRVRWP